MGSKHQVIKLADDLKFIEELTAFSKLPRSRYLESQWIYGKYMQVYMRTGLRYICGSYHPTLTVANVQVHREGQGIYNDFLLLVESLTDDMVYIENVLLLEQQSIYLRRGYEIVSTTNCEDGASLAKAIAKEATL